MDRIDDVEGSILRNDPIVPGHYLAAIRLYRPLVDADARPVRDAQAPGSDVFLRRPFSIYALWRSVAVDRLQGSGQGDGPTSPASRPRTKVMVLGPLGKGFSVPSRPLPRHSCRRHRDCRGLPPLDEAAQGRAALFWGCTNAGGSRPHWAT